MTSFVYSRVLPALAMILLFSRCAQVAPLTGGGKDSTAPTVKSAHPENASRNFNSKTITLQLDEYVVLKDIANQVIITPQLKSMPDMEVRGKQIVIRFYDPLAPNTTYRIYFGNAITDLHEGNILSAYEYVFSTGPNIDSLKISGTINNAFNNTPGSEVLVALYDAQQQDSIAYKEKPAYIAKSDAAGTFRLNYLHPGLYKMLAFKDLNKNLLYDAGEESIAFLNAPLSLQKDTSVRLELFKEIPSKAFLRKSYSAFYGKATLIFNKTGIAYDIQPLQADQKDKIQVVRSTQGDTAIVLYDNIYDTLKLSIRYPDKQRADTLRLTINSQQDYKRLLKDKKLPLSFTSNVTGSGRFPYYARPVLRFARALEEASVKQALPQISFSSVSDSTLMKKKAEFRFEAPDKLILEYTLQPGSEYKLYIPAGSIKDRMGISNDSIQVTFKTTTLEDEGRLSLKLFFPKKENYIVQLLNDKEQVVYETYTELSLTSSSEKIFQIAHLAPAAYYVKVIEDTNKNKRWDTGDYIQHRFPEKVFTNATAIKVLADWDIESEWKVE